MLCFYNMSRARGKTPDKPVEELVFFLVVPFAAVLTLEAVRSVRGWSVGDEPPGERP